ncbi:MAG: hypothetical protein ABSF00_13035 [Candidatus Bathyarchaeia archaeon]|jgi:uncharacterized coiled-coil DUF342 family protein
MDSTTLETPVENLYRELETLKERNDARRAKINLLREQIEEIVKKRDTLNSEVKRTSEEIRKVREKRDSLNAKVKELKDKRDALRVLASQKREALSKLLEQARRISEQLQGSMSELSRQIKGLEWFIQTNPLSTKAERNLVAKIGALEVDLAKHKGLRNVKDKLLQLRVEVGALRLQAQATHEELTKVAEESEKIHAAMQELVKILVAKKKEADAKHSEYLEKNQERRDVVAELRANLERMDKVRAQIGEAKTIPKLKAEKLKSKYKEAANEKVRTGGKLSFEEFQALMDDGGSEDDDE